MPDEDTMFYFYEFLDGSLGAIRINPYQYWNFRSGQWIKSSMDPNSIKGLIEGIRAQEFYSMPRLDIKQDAIFTP